MANGQDDIKMTLEDFANWLLTLPEEVKSKKIWFIDVTQPYKGKGLFLDESPSGDFVSIEDADNND